MAEKTLQEMYAAMEAEAQAKETRQQQEKISETAAKEARLRDYYETSKIADVPIQNIYNNTFDYKKAERIFAKAMTLIKDEMWQTYPEVSVEDGKVGMYDKYLGYKYTIDLDQCYKGTKKENHFGLTVPTAIPVKTSLSMYFKPVSLFSKGKKPETLPVTKIPEAQIKLVMPLNDQIAKAKKNSSGTQEFVVIHFNGSDNDYSFQNKVHLFKDGTVINLPVKAWNIWQEHKTEDEAAVQLAFIVNNRKFTAINVDTTYYLESRYKVK